MKRCPECQFLYDNETTICDMDGTPLRYTVKLPTVPGLAQSIWDKWTIALLFAVVAATVLVILYRATPRAYTSTARQMRSAQETPAVNQSPPSADSPASFDSPATQAVYDDSDSSTDARDPFAAMSAGGTKALKSKRGVQAVDEKDPTAVPAIHVQVAENPQVVTVMSNTAEATTSEPAGKSVQKAAPSSIHPTPPPVSNKVTPTAPKKESGFKSMLKKAGKVLKKPFGEN